MYAQSDGKVRVAGKICATLRSGGPSVKWVCVCARSRNLSRESGDRACGLSEAQRGFADLSLRCVRGLVILSSTLFLMVIFPAAVLV